MTIITPTISNTTAATTTSYAQLEAAATAANPRIYLSVENTDATDNLILAVGAAASEVAIATIAPGATKVFTPITFAKLGFNTVPQGRLAIKASANTPTYNKSTAAATATNLR